MNVTANLPVGMLCLDCDRRLTATNARKRRIEDDVVEWVCQDCKETSVP